MASVKIVNSKQIKEAFGALAKTVKDLRPYKQAIQAEMIADVTDHFEEERGPSSRWKRQKKSTLINREMRKLRGKKATKPPSAVAGKILQDRGNLKNSLRKGGDGFLSISTKNSVGIGTKVQYANIHDSGGTIRRPSISKVGGKLRFVSRDGASFVFAQSVGPATIKIPKREFMWLTDDAMENIANILGEDIQRAWDD